jgi:hypothetical protein
MTLWEVYIVSTASPHAHVVVELERLHSTWETFDEAMRMAGEMLGLNVRLRERFEDDTPVMRNVRGDVVAVGVRRQRT